MKKQALCMAILGMSVAVHAEHLASPPDCARVGAGFSSSPSAASFTWSTERRAADAPARAPLAIALWGDSLTAGRDFIDAALSAAGIPAATVLPSFIQPGMTVPGLRLPLRAGCASQGWRLAYAYRAARDQAGFARGMLRLSSENPGDTLSLDFRFPLPSTRVKRLTLLYEKPTPDALLLLGVRVDDGEEQLISLSRMPGPALQIRPDAPMAALRLRLVAGTITVHGFLPSYREPPAAVLDALSVPGGTLRSWSSTDERLFPAPSQAAADYSLILIQYGTNEGADHAFSRDSYASYLRSHLRRLRTFYPRARCILIGPPDRGVVGSAGGPGALAYSTVHHQIALAQQQAGREHGCEFWDWQAAMGGPGSAGRWAGMHPPRMQPDLTHLTASGYQVSGRMFADALLRNLH